MGEKKRIFAYDAIKVLAIFLVVFYHVGMLDLGYTEGVYYYPNLPQLLALFTACGVPLFFMVNGALTVRRDYDLKKTLIKMARCVFIAAFWGLVFYAIKSIRDQGLSVLSFYKYYWFLLTLAMLYGINYVLGKLPRWCRWCLVAALLIYPFINNMVWDFTALFGNTYGIHWKRSGLFTLYGVVYLYVGDYLAHNHHRLPRWLIVQSAVIGFVLLIIQAMAAVNLMHRPFEGGNYCFPTVGALLLSIPLFVWGFHVHLKDGLLKRYISFLANNTLGIYIFHMLLMVSIAALFPHFSETDINLNPAVVALICIIYMTISACLSEALRRLKLGFLLKL